MALTGLFVVNTNAQANVQPIPPSKKNDTPLKIKSKPSPSTRGCQPGSGLMRLRVTFDKSAKITNVEQISASGCDDFDDSAIRAAKSIKFVPETKEGVPITVTKTVEYAYHSY